MWVPSRHNPLGGRGLRSISLLFVVVDATASTPPLFSTSSRKPLPQMITYLWDRTLVLPLEHDISQVKTQPG